MAAPVAAFAVALLIGGLIVALLGKSPLDAFRVYFVEPLTQDWSLEALAVKASPLVLIAVGLCFCFRANLWNIGAEGQFIAGGALGGALALATHGVDHAGPLGGSWILPAMLALGVVGGALYAMIPAVLLVTLGVSEILTSLMLVYVARLGLDYLVRGPWRDPQGFNFPVSVTFDRRRDAAEPRRGRVAPCRACSSRWPSPSVAAVVFGRTMLGYEIRIVGSRAAGRALRGLQRAQARAGGLRACRAASRASPASSKFRGRSASCSRRSRPVTASPPSSSPSSGACSPGASWWPASSWR